MVFQRETRKVVFESRSTYSRLAYFPEARVKVDPVVFVVAWVATGAERYIRPASGSELFSSSVLSSFELVHGYYSDIDDS